MMDSKEEAEIRLIDRRLGSCEIVIPNIPANARWEQNGVTVAGGIGHGSNTNQLFWPHGIFVDDDDDQTLLISDCSNHRIIQWNRGDAYGKVVAGGNGAGHHLYQLNCPVNVLVDKMTKSMILVDRGNRRLVRWSRHTGTTHGELLIDNVLIEGLAFDEQRRLYVSDTEKHEVRRYDLQQRDQKGTLVAGGNGVGSKLDQFNWPGHLFFDRNQSLYVADFHNHRVMKWENNAKQGVIVAGGQGEGNSLTQIWGPTGIYVDTLGTLYVAEFSNSRITRWSERTKQGTVVVGGSGAEEGVKNPLNGPMGLTFDKYGNLYAADYGYARVQRFALIQ